MLTVAMDTALASVGGLCVGTREVVDHQRLSGAGYCFSGASCVVGVIRLCGYRCLFSLLLTWCPPCDVV